VAVFTVIALIVGGIIAFSSYRPSHHSSDSVLPIPAQAGAKIDDTPAVTPQDCDPKKDPYVEFGGRSIGCPPFPPLAGAKINDTPLFDPNKPSTTLDPSEPTPIPTSAARHTVKQADPENVAPLTRGVDVYYADDWEKANSSCSLLTGRSFGSTRLSLQDLSRVWMRCGDITGNYSDWSHAPYFTARILLDGAAMQKFNSNTQYVVPLFCEDKLEANGDLHCKKR
jgi:hypothetical protein